MSKAVTQTQRGTKAVAALPDSIRVLVFDITIEKWTPHQAQGMRRFGEFSAGESVIRIQSDMPSAAKAVDTFVHELLHVIMWAMDLGDGEKEEHVVGHLATGLVTVHRDNPWLAPWIAEHTR